MDLCTVISSTDNLASGSYAHLTISYAPGTLPDGYIEDEIDIFHEGPDGIVDITESRDTEQQTVTGRITDFSKFIVAVALHEAPEEGFLRKQVFVGESELVFNEVPLPTVTFDDTEYSIGSVVTANVQDETANTDQFLRNSINVDITSDSDPEGIVLTLSESGNDTGVFSGTFQLVEDSSSTLDRELLVGPGDEIMGSYLLPTKAPFRIMFDDVVESGMVELQPFTVDQRPNRNIPDFDAIGDAYSARLVDARLGVDAEITVIMSYVNVDLADDEIISIDFFRVVQSDPESISSGAVEWFDITSGNPVDGVPAIDPEMKTVTGVATFLGNFTIGHDLREGGPIGGGGGGIPRPGTGIILLESASVEQDDEPSASRSGGSGGGGSRSAGITQTSSGTDVETSITIESRTVTFRFESVQAGSGRLSVE
ncbi:MAG: hypothetical protein ACREBU_20400, partial [Nitrososphaera sp.]